MKNKPLLYTFLFALFAILSCILVLLVGLYFGKYLKGLHEKSKAVSAISNTVTYVIDAGHGGEDAGDEPNNEPAGGDDNGDEPNTEPADGDDTQPGEGEP